MTLVYILAALDLLIFLYLVIDDTDWMRDRRMEREFWKVVANLRYQENNRTVREGRWRRTNWSLQNPWRDQAASKARSIDGDGNDIAAASSDVRGES